MSRSFLQLGQSEWWVLLILLVSVAVSYFLYVKKNVPWNTIQNRVLFALRTLAIFCLLLLLLDPSINSVINTVEKPTLALAIDNSESVLARGANQADILKSIEEIKSVLNEEGIEVETFTLENGADSLVFNQRTTRLSTMLNEIDQKMSEKNFAGTILMTDGIYNRGVSPLYRNYVAPIFAIGMGDSIPPKDIGFSRVLYNKVTFKGNETPLRLEISQQGYVGRKTTVTVRENGKAIETKEITFNSDVQEIEFLINSEEEGLRHLVASIPSDQSESTLENNKVDVFLEVIDGRQKVLIVANAPHPDIKAIRSTLAETDNYTTELYVPTIDREKPNGLYDVVIYHGAFSSGINYQPKENPGIWYILSGESVINAVNKELPYLSIERRGGQPDKVTGSFNQSFSKFKIENTEIFEEYPPIEVPFGEYQTSGPSEVLMYQKLGSVITRKPLMVVHDDGTNKSAVLMGQNIWQWKLQEAAIHDNALQFQNFINKTIQYLSVKNDKKQFRFDARSSTFNDASPIYFDTEVYNDIYERIYNNQIQISITNENGDTQRFDFTDSEINSAFKAPGLAPGIYSYSASVKVGDDTFTDGGEFLVENINPEYLNLTANHRLLRNLSTKTGGQFLPYAQIDQLSELIKNREFKSVIESKEEYQELNKSWWWYLIIFALFSSEWVLRRYWGGY